MLLGLFVVGTGYKGYFWTKEGLISSMLGY